MSEFTDKSEFKRIKIIEYNNVLGEVELVYKGYEGNQKENIKRLAKILDETGHPKEKICAKVTHDVEKFGIKDRYVRQVLGDEYKDKNKVREICGTTAAKEEPKKKLLVTTNGEIIDEDAEKALDEIYNPRRLKQQMDSEIREEKEETLLGQNYDNVPLSLIPPDIRELRAKFDEQEAIIKQLREDLEAETQKCRKYSSIALDNSEVQSYRKQNADLTLQLNHLRKEIQELRLTKRCPNCQNMPQVD